MERRKCTQRGHYWISVEGQYALPVQACGRWFCTETRMAPWFITGIEIEHQRVSRYIRENAVRLGVKPRT